ncbi:MAG: hypothetical protein M3Z25_09015 [Actinomycetota bacterium]|nr:hypothetical protein [Actinomycetota bacterium]
MAVSVPLPDEGDLLFIAATAAWRLDAESVRERQAVALTDLDARHRTALPTIIAGDSNAAPDASSIRYLSGLQSIGGRSVHYHDAWAVAGNGPGHTWTTANPNARTVVDQIIRQPNHQRRLDYVFIGSWHAHRGAHCHVRNARIRPTRRRYLGQRPLWRPRRCRDRQRHMKCGAVNSNSSDDRPDQVAMLYAAAHIRASIPPVIIEESARHQ